MCLSPSERLIAYYFVYVSIIAPFMMERPLWGFAVCFAVALVVLLTLFSLTKVPSRIRDWAPLSYTLLAYRQMDWFTPTVRDYHLEKGWILWDRYLLDQIGFRAAIEGVGGLIPGYLELCYVLLYIAAPVSVVTILVLRRRDQLDRFWIGYLVGTLGAYALFPFFPSDPPRRVFPGADLSQFQGVIRQVNLWLTGHYGIHSSVFPSAHVSAAFAAVWSLLLILPNYRWIGYTMLAYAISVGVSVVYGRYHYAADVVAGVGISLLAALATWLAGKGSPRCFP